MPVIYVALKGWTFKGVPERIMISKPFASAHHGRVTAIECRRWFGIAEPNSEGSKMKPGCFGNRADYGWPVRGLICLARGRYAIQSPLGNYSAGRLLRDGKRKSPPGQTMAGFVQFAAARAGSTAYCLDCRWFEHMKLGRGLRSNRRWPVATVAETPCRQRPVPSRRRRPGAAREAWRGFLRTRASDVTVRTGSARAYTTNHDTKPSRSIFRDPVKSACTSFVDD